MSPRASPQHHTIKKVGIRPRGDPVRRQEVGMKNTNKLFKGGPARKQEDTGIKII